MPYQELNMDLTDEQIRLKKSVHRFAREVIRPAAYELDNMADPNDTIKEDSPLRKIMKQMRQLGYHTALIPDTYGGLGLDPLDLHIFWEEIAWGSSGIAVSLGADSFPAVMACMLGSDQLIDEIVAPFVEDMDYRLIGCWAMTEPNHGSDYALVGTPPFRDPKFSGEVMARRDGSQWVLNGQKAAWVSNGSIASHALTFVNIDPSMGMAGCGAAVVPLSLPGASRGKCLNKLGKRDLPQGEIYLDGVRIPERYMLAGPDTCEPILDQLIAMANATMGAIATGAARAAFDEALRYSMERTQGGKLLCEHQLVQKMLFDMATKVETARAFSRNVMLYNLTNIPPLSRYSVMSKVYCTNIAYEVAHDAVQIFGGCGISKEFLIEKLFRDARMMLIEDGSNTVLPLAGAHTIINPEEG
ncbi:MAG: acyl-CoA dehydrogenase family protein [Desulfocucumaceae bacterium]